jgi:hypothetical protein
MNNNGYDLKLARFRRASSVLVFGHEAQQLLETLEHEPGVHCGQTREVTQVLFGSGSPQSPRIRTVCHDDDPDCVELELELPVHNGLRLETLMLPRTQLKLALQSTLGRELLPWMPDNPEPVLVVTSQRRHLGQADGWHLVVDSQLAFHEFDPTGAISVQALTPLVPPFARETGMLFTLFERHGEAPPLLKTLRDRIPPFELLRRGLVSLSSREATAAPLTSRLLSQDSVAA